ARLADPLARRRGRPPQASRRRQRPAPPPPGRADAQPAPQDRSPTVSYLELRNISKTYGQDATEVHALQDVDLRVEAGSLVAAMGPSGSGKSTLLTIAGSLEDPTTGEVVVDGTTLSSLSRNGKAALRRRSLGFVFQDFNLLAGLTAVENVALPLELDGGSARRAPAPGRQAPA